MCGCLDRDDLVVSGMSRKKRYEVLLAPFGGFTIFDRKVGRPAEFSGYVLVGLQKQDAELIALILDSGGTPNRKYLASLGLPRG